VKGAQSLSVLFLLLVVEGALRQGGFRFHPESMPSDRMRKSPKFRRGEPARFSSRARR
jgi:hypothetical protein